jgi:hypothetical protein
LQGQSGLTTLASATENPRAKRGPSLFRLKHHLTMVIDHLTPELTVGVELFPVSNIVDIISCIFAPITFSNPSKKPRNIAHEKNHYRDLRRWHFSTVRLPDFKAFHVCGK